MSWAKVLCVLITGPLFCITHSKSSNANILLRISWDRGSRGPVGSISQQTVHFFILIQCSISRLYQVNGHGGILDLVGSQRKLLFFSLFEIQFQII